MADTSLLCFKGVKARGLTKREQEVYEQIQNTITRNSVFYGRAGATLYEVSKAMHERPNRISGRFSGLRDRGKIKDSGMRRENDDGEYCRVWVIA